MASKKRIVIALGGNALLKRGEPLTYEKQKLNAKNAARAIAAIVAQESPSLCITHGNGPQVGLLANLDPSMPLDVLGAESEGQIAYILEMELANVLKSSELVSVLTQVIVDAKDPAFESPTKPIGPSYDKEQSDALVRDKGFVMKQDGEMYRRVVASPQPLRITESRAIKFLLDQGFVTICCGGGGIPIVERTGEEGTHRDGVEAVIDKDAASSLLAAQIKADVLLMLTDAPCVYDPVKWPSEKVPLPSPVSIDQVQNMAFPPGSMGPKIKAAVDFVRQTGGTAGIGALEDALDILNGARGTLITR